MALTEHASGSQTATLDTPHKLGTTDDGTDGLFSLMVDVTNLARGDRLVLRFYEKTRAADTKRLVWETVLMNEQVEKVAYSPWFGGLHAWDFELEQTDGTGRAFPWSIRKA
jgi:hypothetical protein